MSAVGRFSLPLVRPLETAGGAIDRREGYLVRLGDDPAGLGEASPLPGWTESLDDCGDALEAGLSAAAELRGPDGLPAMAETPAARHGLELAILDRAAVVSGDPLYRHLGGSRRVSSLPANATVGDGDAEATVDAAVAAVDRGFDAVKLKAGARPVEADLDRVAAVREAVGDGVELRVDANGAWEPATAATAVDGLAADDVAVVEQPLAPGALDGHAELRGRGPAIALDETLSRHGLDRVLEAEAADLLVLKPMVLGGVGRAREVADGAREAGVGVLVTTTVDAAVARTAAVHLAAALDVERACGLATAEWLAEDVAPDPAPVVDGSISVPQAAGHGVGVGDLE